MVLKQYAIDRYLYVDNIVSFLVITDKKRYSFFENHLPSILNLIDGKIEYVVRGAGQSAIISDLNGMLYFSENTLTLILKH